MKPLVTAILVLLVPAIVGAQQVAEPVPPPGSVALNTPPAPAWDLPNLRFEITIVDEGGGGPALKKTVSTLARANNTVASVRSMANLERSHAVYQALLLEKRATTVGLSVDTRGLYDPKTKKVSGRVTVNYQPFWPEAKALPASVTTQVDAVFDEGKPMLIAQAADPITDRRTTIQVTVTVLR